MSHLQTLIFKNYLYILSYSFLCLSRTIAIGIPLCITKPGLSLGFVIQEPNLWNSLRWLSVNFRTFYETEGPISVRKSPPLHPILCALIMYTPCQFMLGRSILTSSIPRSSRVLFQVSPPKSHLHLF